MKKPEYFVILPSWVRYDERLKPMEKIIYSELVVLSRVKGYCYVNNSYFVKLYGVHKNTVSVWINNLVKYGFITTKYIMKDKQIEERRIYIVEKGKKNPIIEIKAFENLEENLVDELFDKSRYQVIEKKEIQEKVESLAEEKIVEKNISEDKVKEEIEKELENEIEEINGKVEEKREKTPEELEEVRKKLLKDLFGEKFVREAQERKAEEEESKSVEEECTPLNKNADRILEETVEDNEKIVGVSIEKVGGYPLKNSKPINKKIEYNNTSRIIQDYYYKKNIYHTHSHIDIDRFFDKVTPFTSYG